MRSPSGRPRSRHASAIGWLALAAALAAIGCSRRSEPQAEQGPADSLPPVALSERAQRDSARVARLVFTYYAGLAHRDTAKALSLFYPESILVAAPGGQVVIEGRSSDAERRVAAAAERGAKAVRRIVLLRRVTTELLEQAYRETWLLRFVPEAADSSVVETRFHVIQHLASDERYLGRVEADSS